MEYFADIAIHQSWIEDSLTYTLIPNVDTPKVGIRVHVELNGKLTEGVIIRLHSQEPNYRCLPIQNYIDSEPIVSEEQLSLAFWMREQYLSSLGDCLFKMIPKGKRKKESPKKPKEVRSEFLQQLNAEQKQAFLGIRDSKAEQRIHLLFGITGSGKTEVYLHLMNEVLQSEDASIIFLVPEISLTYPMIQRIEKVFPNQVAVLHSYLRTKERFQNYWDILQGKKRIVIGTRSAIFAPVRNLSLVLIDEEHDTSFKENSSPRYHARQIADKRLKETNGKLVLGSATPSLEMYHFALQGKIGFHRISKRAVPEAKEANIAVNQKLEDKQLISGDLQFKIHTHLQKNEQVLILLNRRGYHPLVYDEETKEFIHCPKCSANLCFHSNQILRCHLCGFQESFNYFQKQSKKDLSLMGAGSQKLEENLLELFPSAKVERLDQDSTKQKEVIAEVFQKLEEGQIDILTGTQMIAKGLDFPNVTLVGILNANHGLGVPDFRSSERTYSLLSQVAGRAGRGVKPGEVFIQSSDPEHPVIKLALNQNYHEFYLWEIAFRKSLHYPPFSRLVRLVFRSKKEDECMKTSLEYRTRLESQNLEGAQILGPSPCPFVKIDDNYRYHILLKTNAMEKLREQLRDFKKNSKPNIHCYVEYDFDPVDLV
ncbi:primosomal protein N [Leptospira ryugenii]|uniref:Replication restart protein PriA n=1 Tax=Leptospira ryugenii TaxID=1917863 RepID=A0A2P2DWP5_9LEPT|nr:primosomal protein N' [Leptospira ryugenii]GBF49053.1 primosomal protein N [Leptospira ryugenii]